MSREIEFVGGPLDGVVEEWPNAFGYEVAVGSRYITEFEEGGETISAAVPTHTYRRDAGHTKNGRTRYQYLGIRNT